MGLKLSEEQVADVQELGARGMPIYLGSSTTKGLELTTLSEKDEKQVQDYLGNGGTANYQNLYAYIRSNLDDKIINVPKVINPPLEIPSDVLFYKDEKVAYDSVKDFEAYCAQKGFHKEGNKKVIVMTSIMGPFSVDREHFTSLITELEGRGLNVYPISGFGGRLKFMKEIEPDLIVYLPHGRLSLGGGNAEEIVAWLKERNVPLLCPLTVHLMYDQWVDDRQGMMGGLLSQSVTMPEFDGGIAPYAVFTEFLTEDGFVVFKAVPNRLKKFGDMVSNYLNLQKLENKDKKVAIVYFKGPGKNALTAADMEVLPSLFNVLTKMKAEGYNLGKLPSDYATFKKQINTQGVVLGSYAQGAFDSYLKNGNPVRVPIEEYNAWCKKDLPAQLIQEVEDKYENAADSYMSYAKDGKDYIAVARVQYGNVVVMPQPMPGEGDNHFELVHGANVAPPHSYIAPYLWIQEGFKANSLIHFGTHGSVEFTPGKQIALSDYDWTDPLIGSTPHSYIYTISNIGEAMIAKRRSYAAIITHLTPPFIQANASSDYRELVRNSDSYSTAKGAVKKEYALAVKRAVVELGIHKELRFDSLVDVPYNDEQMLSIANYLASLENEKITGGLYTIGKAYDKAKLDETVKMIYCDALALGLAEFDIVAGKISRDGLKNKAIYNSQYLSKSKNAIDRLLTGSSVASVKNTLIAPAIEQRIAKYKADQRVALQKMMEEQAKKKAEEPKEEVNTEEPKAAEIVAEKPSSGGHPSWIPKGDKRPESSNAKKASTSTMHPGKPDGMTGATQKLEVPKDSVEELYLSAYAMVNQAINDLQEKRKQFVASPQLELEGILDALNGGYVDPTSGGDPIANPESVPTGKICFLSMQSKHLPKQHGKLGKNLVMIF